ncbi:DUF4352 domain-containing protein [Microbacterium aurantiacum]|uniref:DUF4352 domain-containing protein n=1 Tax=Microbacterium aurantiacum TaxID=162393 RepID=UPI0011AEF4FD|nr:DUF4352 domain-containing protein [Microbacterium aurantiacum]
MKTVILPWLLTVVLLAGAWALVKITLPVGSAQEPFVTAAELGEEAFARNFAVTVTEVHAARTVIDSEGWSAEGTWLVVDLEAAAQVKQEGTSLRVATLTIGERTFSATDRGATFYREGLVTGVPRSGSLAFEIPDDVLGEHATLRLGATGNPVLDGVIEMRIDLAALPVDSEVTLQENGWAR